MAPTLLFFMPGVFAGRMPTPDGRIEQIWQEMAPRTCRASLPPANAPPVRRWTGTVVRVRHHKPNPEDVAGERLRHVHVPKPFRERGIAAGCVEGAAGKRTMG